MNLNLKNSLASMLDLVLELNCEAFSLHYDYSGHVQCLYIYGRAFDQPDEAEEEYWTIHKTRYGIDGDEEAVMQWLAELKVKLLTLTDAAVARWREAGNA